MSENKLRIYKKSIQISNLYQMKKRISRKRCQKFKTKNNSSKICKIQFSGKLTKKLILIKNLMKINKKKKQNKKTISNQK